MINAEESLNFLYDFVALKTLVADNWYS